jgi:hypothetical protein
MRRVEFAAAVCGLVMSSVIASASATTTATVRAGTTPLRGNAVDASGHLWVPYGIPEYSSTGFKDELINVAHQVSGQGRGCLLPTWSCSRVDKDANASQVSIAASSAGEVWLAFYVNDNHGRSALKVAHYVGAGGAGCTSSQWSCELVADSQSVFRGETAPGIAVLPDGTPVVVFSTGTTTRAMTSILIARRAPGAGCANPGWTCSLVEHAPSGYTGFPAIATQASGEIDVAYIGVSGSVTVAGTRVDAPASRGCAAGFQCQRLSASVDPNAFFPSVTLTVGPQSRLWLAFPSYGAGNSSTSVGVAHQSGAGHWTVESVDGWSAAYALNYASVAFDSLGHAFVAYQDSSFRVLRVAEQVGGTSTCNSATSPGWQCSTVDSSPNGMIGLFPAIARTGAGFSITYGESLTTMENITVATL